MANSIVRLPLGHFPDPDRGRPLFNAKIWVGEPDTLPANIPANQKLVTGRQEDGTEVPLAQPIRTSSGGIPVDADGNYVTLLVDGAYSMRVDDRNDNQVYYFADVLAGAPVTFDDKPVLYRDTVALAVADIGLSVGQYVTTKVYATVNDGGGADYVVVAGGTGADDGGSYHNMSNGNQLELIINEKIRLPVFGATGDGVTDDLVPLTNALAFCDSNGLILDYGEGFNYLVSGNIPLFKDVKACGTSVITRGSDEFQPLNQTGHTNTLYISTTGVDTNDGLTSSIATTVTGVKNYLEDYSESILQGEWIIKIEAGTYPDFQLRLDDVISESRIIVRGEAADFLTQPATILQGNASLVGAIIFNTRMYTKVENVFIQNYTNIAASGVIANNGCNMWTENVWADNILNAAINFNSQNRAFTTGGTITNCRIGIRCYSGTTMTLGFNGASNPTTITGCTQSGVDIRDATSGDVFYTNCDSNSDGITIYNNARVRIENCQATNNTNHGVRCYLGGMVNSSGSNTVSGNATDFEFNSYAGDFALFDSDTLVRPYVEVSASTATGSTSEIILNNALTIPQGELVDRGKSIEINAFGEHSETGTKDVLFRIGGVTIFTFQLPSTSPVKVPWVVNIKVFGFSPTLAKWYGVLQGATTDITVEDGLDLGLGASSQLLEVATTNSSVDSIVSLQGIEVVGTGIGTGQAW